jgi:hypothetical protein
VEFSEVRRSNLGAPPAQRGTFDRYLVRASPIFTVEYDDESGSFEAVFTGEYRGTSRKIEATFSVEEGTPKLLSWRELYE